MKSETERYLTPNQVVFPLKESKTATATGGDRLQAQRVEWDNPWGALASVSGAESPLVAAAEIHAEELLDLWARIYKKTINLLPSVWIPVPTQPIRWALPLLGTSFFPFCSKIAHRVGGQWKVQALSEVWLTGWLGLGSEQHGCPQICHAPMSLSCEGSENHCHWP